MLMRLIIERMFLAHSTRNQRENMRFSINMAASGAWRKVLNNHPIFEELRKFRNDLKQVNDSKNFINIQDGELFVWDSYNFHLLTTNLKNLVQRNDKCTYQTILCTCPTVGEVESLVFSPTGLHVALVGQKSVSVLELPRRWGKYAEYEGGKDRITCRNIPIGDRLFSSSTRLRILQASWHPGSVAGTHIAILTSDNILRIYDITEPNTAEQSISLTGNDAQYSVSSSRNVFAAALGDNVVAFDFGPSVELKLKHKRDSSTTVPEQAWPVYLLRGNGDVCMVHTSLNSKRRFTSQVIGPLHMHPPAEDNYGTDACSILCLQSNPAVLVIATCEGKLHHCIVLNTDDDNDVSSEVSWASTDTGTPYEHFQEPSLYVFESIELELSLKTVAIVTDEIISDDFNCPIRLHKDPAAPDRYHCSHSAGVHSVMLPWLPNLQQFCEDEDNTAIQTEFNTDEHSLVEHLICTKPSPSSSPSPVLGLCVASDHLLGTHLLCLTGTLECISLPLRHTARVSPYSLISTGPLKKVLSPLRKVLTEPFDQYIKKILQRNSSNPILKSDGSVSLNQQECFQLLSRATQVFREEYVQKLDLAREEIERRVRFLRDQKGQQIADLDHCKQSRNILTESARQLAEKFEDAQEKQQMLADRVETVAKKIQSRLPVLSDAERNMQRELKVMEDKIKDFRISLQQVKMKQKYQESQLARAKYSENTSPAINRNQMMQVKSVMKEEGDEIASLVKKLNQLKTQVDL